MTPEREQRFAQLRSVREMWRDLRPDETISKGRAVKGQISFEARHEFDSNMIFEEHVQFLSIADDPWTLAVRGVCADERVRQLRKEAQGLDVGFVLSFDVLATYNFVSGKKRWILPKCVPDVSDRNVRKLFLDYVKKLDGIWDVVGGCGRESFQSLVLWQIANRAATGAGDADMPKACAAYIYGEPKLALELLAEFETAWELSLQEDRGAEPARSMYARVKKAIDKLRRIIG
jgi:hypothetical protein